MILMKQKDDKVRGEIRDIPDVTDLQETREMIKNLKTEIETDFSIDVITIMMVEDSSITTVEIGTVNTFKEQQ